MASRSTLWSYARTRLSKASVAALHGANQTGFVHLRRQSGTYGPGGVCIDSILDEGGWETSRKEEIPTPRWTNDCSTLDPACVGVPEET